MKHTAEYQPPPDNHMNTAAKGAIMESNHHRLVQSLLIGWGAWARLRTGEVRGYPNQATFRRLYNLPGQMGGPTPLADEPGEMVDRAVTKLRQVHPDQAAVVKAYYVDGWTSEAAGRTLGLRQTASRDLLRRAESSIELLLDPDVIY